MEGIEGVNPVQVRYSHPFPFHLVADIMLLTRILFSEFGMVIELYPRHRYCAICNRSTQRWQGRRGWVLWVPSQSP